MRDGGCSRAPRSAWRRTPPSKLVEHGWRATPIRILALMVENLGQPLPASVSFVAVRHLHDRDDGHRALGDHAAEGLRMNRCSRPFRVRVGRAPLATTVMVGEEVHEDRAHHGSVDERADRTAPHGVLPRIEDYVKLRGLVRAREGGLCFLGAARLSPRYPFVELLAALLCLALAESFVVNAAPHALAVSQAIEALVYFVFVG